MALDSPTKEEKKEGKKVGAFRAPQENFTCNDFIYGKLLGLGSYSKVVRVKKKDTGQEYALKVMDKRHIMRENKVQYVKMERLILDQLDHPGVTRLHFTFQDNLYLYMGMECCNGGELFDQIKRKGHLSVEETRFYAAEIVDTLEYIHSEGLIHRDLKPENILFTSDGHVKIADFGSSKMLRSFTNGIITCDPDEKSCTFVGTAEYVAPEVLNSQPITPRVDMWALGCVIFQMLDGKPPFKAASEYLTFQKVMSRDFVMPQQFPPEAKDLIEKLLSLVPVKRPDFSTIKKHPFFSGVTWNDLWTMPAPSLSLPPGQTGEDWDVAQLQAGLEAFELSESSESGSASNSQTSSPKANVSGEFSRSPSRRRSFSPSEGLLANRTLTEDCTLEQWQRFLNPGEKLLGTSVVRKYSGMVTRMQQLLLTNKPRLAIVDLKKFIIKQEITWSNIPNEFYVEVEDHSRFSIRTPNLIWHFEDLGGLAHGWRSAIEKLQNELLCSRKEQLSKDDGSKTEEESIDLPHVPFQTLSKDDGSKTEEESTDLPYVPFQTDQSGQTRMRSQAEPLSNESPADIQEPLSLFKLRVGNQNSQLDLRQGTLQAIPLNKGQKTAKGSLLSSLGAASELVQSAQVYNDMDVGTLADKETSRDLKDECEGVLFEDKLVSNQNEFDAVLGNKKSNKGHHSPEPGLVGYENEVKAQSDQLTCTTQEQVLPVKS